MARQLRSDHALWQRLIALAGEMKVADRRFIEWLCGLKALGFWVLPDLLSGSGGQRQAWVIATPDGSVDPFHEEWTVHDGQEVPKGWQAVLSGLLSKLTEESRPPDPQPTLHEDTARWTRLYWLCVEAEERELATSLHGMRAMGLRVVPDGDGYSIAGKLAHQTWKRLPAKPSVPDWVWRDGDGLEKKAGWEALRDKYLLPHLDALLAALGRLWEEEQAW